MEPRDHDGTPHNSSNNIYIYTCIYSYICVLLYSTAGLPESSGQFDALKLKCPGGFQLVMPKRPVDYTLLLDVTVCQIFLIHDQSDIVTSSGSTFQLGSKDRHRGKL